MMKTFQRGYNVNSIPYLDSTDPLVQKLLSPGGDQKTVISDMKTDIREMTEYIVNWCDTIYPERTPEIVLSKLIEELEELKDRPCDGHELADVGILLLDYCDLVGVDLVKVIHWKMKINKARTWEIDEDGKLQHKRPAKSTERQTLAYCTNCQDPIGGGTPVECLHDIGQPCLADGTRRRKSVTFNE